MYEYTILKNSNEARLEATVNAAAAEGWEVVSYAIRPTGGFLLLFFGFFMADHFAMLRRRAAG